MGRSVFIEENLEDRILKLFGETKWASGILIGQSTLQRDYVIHLALTPPQTSEDASDKGASKKGSKQSNSVISFDEEWFVQHCRQVNCMLTGGLRILGIFVFGPPDMRTKLQPKFRQTLYAVHKMICSELPLARWKLDQTMCNSQVMVQVCSATKKTTCYTVDVSDTKANIQPADMKYQNFVSKWIPLRCSLHLELNFMLPKKTDSKSHFSNLKSGLSSFLLKVANCLATINGEILSDEQVLILEKQKRSTSDKTQIRNVNLYLTENGFDPNIQKCTGRRALLVGRVESRAYLHPKATAKEAVDAIKCDVIRNLLTRCRLLCEDIDDDMSEASECDEELAVTRLELPKRVFAPICRGQLSISDCVFKDEDMKDIVNQILELTGVSVSEEDLVSDELFADDLTSYDELLQDRTALHHNTNTEENSERSSTSYQYLGASLGAITVLMAAMVKWFWDE